MWEMKQLSVYYYNAFDYVLGLGDNTFVKHALLNFCTMQYMLHTLTSFFNIR